MELLNVATLKHLLFYKDKRSVLRWLKENEISVIRIGKQYCVIKEEFDAKLSQLFGCRRKEANTPFRAKKEIYQPQSEIGKSFITHLQQKLSEL